MPKRNLIVILAMLTLAVTAFYVARSAPTSVPVDTPLPADLAPLADALEQVRQKYHQPVDDRLHQKLHQGAVAGMVGQLDPYSTYIPPDQVEAFHQRLHGSGHGLGLRVEVSDGHVVVIGPLMGSPAHRAGLRGGDLIESVDDQPLAGLSIDQVYKRLDDPTHPQAALVIVRVGQRHPFTIPRADLALETVQGLYRDAAGQWVHIIQSAPGVAYIRIREFVRSTPEDLYRVLTNLGTPRGLLLDLRDNPGGTLEAAVATVNFFLAQGRIVTALDRSQKPLAFNARRENLYSDTVPLVVLVNGRTASAAEIVAGALWVHNRAAVTGERTLGKGCVQSMISLGDLGQINLTTATYYLQGGLSITRESGSDVWGIEPHQAVVLLHEAEVDALRIRAEVMPAPPAATPSPATAPTGAGSTERAERVERMEQKFLRLDTQLSQALNLVRDPPEMKRLIKQGATARIKRMPASMPKEK